MKTSISGINILQGCYRLSLREKIVSKKNVTETNMLTVLRTQLKNNIPKTSTRLNKTTKIIKFVFLFEKQVSKLLSKNDKKTFNYFDFE